MFLKRRTEPILSLRLQSSRPTLRGFIKNGPRLNFKSVFLQFHALTEVFTESCQRARQQLPKQEVNKKVWIVQRQPYRKSFCNSSTPFGSADALNRDKFINSPVAQLLLMPTLCSIRSAHGHHVPVGQAVNKKHHQLCTYHQTCH